MRVRRRRARPASAQLDSFHEAQAFLKANVGAPCTRADTEGVKAKDGEEAGTREIKVVAIGIYTHVHARGQDGASDTQPRGRMALRVRLLRRRTRADREHAQTSELQLETLQPTSHCLFTPNPA